MFHQANVIPTALSGGSLLGHWFEQVMAEISTYIAFPVTVSALELPPEIMMVNEVYLE